MRKWAGAVLGISALLLAASAAAEPTASKFTVNFRFEVKFGDGTNTYNENSGMGVNVWLPPDFGWECTRNAISPGEGRTRGSFACTNDGWKTDVLTMVGCRADAVDAPRTAAMRIFAARPDGKPQGSPVDAGIDAGLGNPRIGKFIDLTVTCETALTR